MKEFFARLNPMERRFVVAVIVIFFLVGNLVWIWPHFADWSKTTDRMNTARTLQVKFQIGIDKIPTLQREIAKYQRQGQSVPQDDQAVQFFRLIQNQAAQSGVGIVSMGSTRQSSGTNNPYFLEQNQTIAVQSGEKQLVDFLYSLGAGNSLIRVRVLSVQPDPTHQQLAARITLVASYQKNPKKAAAAAPNTATPAVATPKPAAPNPAPPVPSGAPKSRPPAPAPKPATPTLPAPAPKPLTPNKK